MIFKIMLSKELKLTEEFKKGALETVKEAGRLILFSLIANSYIWLQAGGVDWRIILAEYFLIFQRCADKFVHTYFTAKAKSSATIAEYVSKPRGILPF